MRHGRCRGVEVRLSPEGELLVRGPNVMRGYWKDPVRTAEVLEDGWYPTGDLGSLDAAGNVSLAGRAKDLIVLPSGMKVWPTDVEDVLREHPAVKDAAVLMAPAAGGGATLHAYLIAAGAGQTADLDAIVAACNGRLAQHQRLATASWWPRARLPAHLDAQGAPQPAAAAERRRPRSRSTACGPPTTRWRRPSPAWRRWSASQPAQTLGELGLDSLGLVELALALEEKTGKAVGDGDLRLDMTVEQVRDFLAAAPSAARRRRGTAGPRPEVDGRRAAALAVHLGARLPLPRRAVRPALLVCGDAHGRAWRASTWPTCRRA